MSAPIINLRPRSGNLQFPHLQALDLDIGNNLRLVVQNDVRINDRPFEGKARRSRQSRIASRCSDNCPLLPAERAQSHFSIHPGTARRQLPCKGSVSRLPDTPGQSDPGELGPRFHLDGQGSATGQNIDIGVKGPVIAVAIRNHRIAPGITSYRRGDIAGPYSHTGPRRRDSGNRPRHGTADPDTERAILVGHALGRKIDPAGGRIAAAALCQAEGGCGNIQALDPSDAIAVIGYVGHDQAVAAEEFAHPIVEYPARPGPNGTGQGKATIAAGFQVDIAVDIENAHAFHAIAVDPPLEPAGIYPLVDVSDHHGGGVDPIGIDPEIVGEQPAIGKGEIPVQPDIGQQCPDALVKSRDPLRPRLQRNAPLLFRHFRAATRAQADHCGFVKADARSIERIVDRRRSEITVEDHRSGNARAAEIVGNNRRLEQAEIDVQVAHAVIAKIDHAVGGQPEIVAAGLSLDIESPLLARSGNVDIGNRFQHVAAGAGNEQSRPRLAADGEGTVARANGHVDQSVLAAFAFQRTVPFCPVAFAVQRQANRLCRAGEPGEQTIGRGFQFKCDIEIISVRNRIEAEGEPVAAGNARRAQRPHIPVDDGPGVRNLHVRRHIEQMTFAGHSFGNRQFTDFEPADIDIEIRQQRAFCRSRQQFGQAQEIRRGNDERTDINMAAKEGEGPPVQLHAVRGGKHAFRIAYFQIGNFHLAVQRSFDLPDFQLQPVFKFKRLDLLLDQAMTAVGVQPDIGREQQGQNHGQQCAQSDTQS